MLLLCALHGNARAGGLHPLASCVQVVFTTNVAGPGAEFGYFVVANANSGQLMMYMSSSNGKMFGQSRSSVAIDGDGCE